MDFPDYRLSRFQREHRERVRYFLGGTTPDPVSLQELLSMADADDRQRWQGFSLGFASDQGDDELRDIIAADYPGLKPENIITFAGAQEAITATYQALLNPGDRVVAITPVYEPLSISASLCQADVSHVALAFNETAKETGDDAGWSLHVDDWLETCRPGTRLAAINFPHNPTGAMLSELQLQMMVDHCRQQDTWLFSDEVFRGLEHEGVKKLPAVASLYDKGISLGVMSKAYGLGGVRIGWIACQDSALIERLIEIKQFLSICNSRADEVLAQIALKNRDRLLARSRSIIQANMARVQSSVERLENALHWIPPLAGCAAFPAVKQQAAGDFVETLLDNTGLLLVPADCFMSDQQHVRLGLGSLRFDYAFTRLLNFLDNGLHS